MNVLSCSNSVKMSVLLRTVIVFVTTISFPVWINAQYYSGNITILGLIPFTYNQSLGLDESIGSPILEASVEMAIEDISNTDDLLVGYNLYFMPVDSGCDVAKSAFHFSRTFRSSSPVVVLGPMCNEPAKLIGKTVNPDMNLVSISYGARTVSLTNTGRFSKFFFRTVSPYSELNKAVYHLLLKFSWERVCILIEGKNEFIELAEHFVEYLRQRLVEFTVIHIITERNPEFLVNSFCRIFVIFADSSSNPYVSCALHSLNLTGQYFQSIYVGKFEVDQYFDCPVESAESSILVHFRETLSTDFDFAKGCGKSINHSFGCRLLSHFTLINSVDDTIPDFDLEIAAAAYDAVWSIALAMNASIDVLAIENLTLDDYLPFSSHYVSELVREQFENLNFQGVYKTINFTSERHHPHDLIAVSQFQYDRFVEVAIYDILSDELTENENTSFAWIGLIPPPDRPFELKVDVTLQVSASVSSISACGLILCTIFFIFNVIFRKQKAIKASSPLINAIIIFGCVMIFLSVTSFAFESLYIVPLFIRSYLCNATVWLVFCGFTLSFGSLTVKTWRIYRIFRNPWSRRRIYTDSSLCFIITVLVGIDVIFLTFMSVFSPLKSVDTSIHTIYYTYTYPECEQQGLELDFIAILMIYKILIFCMAGFLALQTRKIKSEAFNDAKWITISIYLIVFSATIGLPVSIYGVYVQHGLLAFYSVVVLLSLLGFIILLTVFIPKLLILKRSQNQSTTEVITSADQPRTERTYQHRNSEFYRKKSKISDENFL